MLKYKDSNHSAVLVFHSVASILSPCLFNLSAEYIMRNAGMEEAQAGIKTAGRDINNLSYADVTSLMAGEEAKVKKNKRVS